MRMDVRDALKNPGRSYPISRSLVLPAEDVLGDSVSFRDVRIEGEAVGAEDSVKVRGRVSAEVCAHCARCLEAVSQGIEVSVEEVFTQTPEAEDPDQHPLEGYAVDLEGIVRDALLLELPLRFVCRADCRGLCPECGTNRNHQSCTCHEGLRSPFSALSEISTDNEEV